MGYLVLCCITCKYVKIFQKCFHVIDVCVIFAVVREHTVHDFNPLKFIETCYMAQKMLYVGEYFMCTWNNYVFWSYWIEYSINVSYIWLIVFFQVSCTLTEFQSTFSWLVNENWWICKRNYGFISLFSS